MVKWPEDFGNELLASAALERLTQHAHMACITAQSHP
jgi:hypothetical protein